MSSEDTASYPSGARLWLLLFRAFRQVEKKDLESVRELGFRCITDFAVLEILLHHGPLPISAIGERVLLTSGSVTTAVDRAVAEGWVERTPDTRDRRSVRVTLTESGRKHIEASYAQHVPTLDAAFGRLSPQERRDLSLLLLKVAQDS